MHGNSGEPGVLCVGGFAGNPWALGRISLTPCPRGVVKPPCMLYVAPREVRSGRLCPSPADAVALVGKPSRREEGMEHPPTSLRGGVLPPANADPVVQPVVSRGVRWAGEADATGTAAFAWAAGSTITIVFTPGIQSCPRGQSTATISSGGVKPPSSETKQQRGRIYPGQSNQQRRPCNPQAHGWLVSSPTLPRLSGTCSPNPTCLAGCAAGELPLTSPTLSCRLPSEHIPARGMARGSETREEGPSESLFASGVSQHYNFTAVDAIADAPPWVHRQPTRADPAATLPTSTLPAGLPYTTG